MLTRFVELFKEDTYLLHLVILISYAGSVNNIMFYFNKVVILVSYTQLDSEDDSR